MPGPGGRPEIPIDWDEFDKLCFMQATQQEIASWFDCSVATIERAVKRRHKMTFVDYREQKAGKGKVSLRRKQFDLALKGDKTMLIWLGKQMLEQSERAVNKNEHTGKDGAPIQVEQEVSYTTSWRKLDGEKG